MNKTIYTIGHSTHSVDTFINLLKIHRITAVGDVRSVPFSRFNPQFNKEQLQSALHSQGIRYVFMGKEFGARSEDSACYKNGKVQFHLLSETALFRKGLERIAKGSEQYRICLMCAEKDPIECHRAILVGRRLKDEGYSVIHILSDGEMEHHEAAEKRLLEMLNMNHQDLFLNWEQIIDGAYRKQNEKIAYTVKTEDSDAAMRL